MAEIVLVGFVREVEMGGGVLWVLYWWGLYWRLKWVVVYWWGGVVWEVVLVQETETVALEAEMGLVLDAGTWYVIGSKVAATVFGNKFRLDSPIVREPIFFVDLR